MKVYANKLTKDEKGMLMWYGFYVVMVTHPSNLYKGLESGYDFGRGYYNARQRKKHLSVALEGKSLCNMNVQMGEEKLDWDSPMQNVRKPNSGAGETCAVCYQKALEKLESQNGGSTK